MKILWDSCTDGLFTPTSNINSEPFTRCVVMANTDIEHIDSLKLYYEVKHIVIDYKNAETTRSRNLPNQISPKISSETESNVEPLDGLPHSKGQ